MKKFLWGFLVASILIIGIPWCSDDEKNDQLIEKDFVHCSKGQIPYEKYRTSDNSYYIRSGNRKIDCSSDCILELDTALCN